MSHQRHRGNQAQSSFSDREWFQRVSHLLLTKRVVQYHRGYARSPAGGRKNDGHSAAGCDQYRFRRREGNMPGAVSLYRLCICF